MAAWPRCPNEWFAFKLIVTFSIKDLLSNFESANILKIPVASNLRQADIILGGHGAPIMPAVEHIIHKPDPKTAFLNIGLLNKISNRISIYIYYRNAFSAKILVEFQI